MKIKVCGMKYNPGEVAKMNPDYLGFIFWEPSPRFFDREIPELPSGIKKVGVFVNSALDDVIRTVEEHGLDAVQLHGHETPAFCEQLKDTCTLKGFEHLTTIKVFSIKDRFDFSTLAPYEQVCDYYLFDTKGKLPGGNSFAFDWRVLEDYPSQKPFFLSGGIGPEAYEELQSFLKSRAAQYCYAVDLNSKFEEAPGLKNIEQLRKFQKHIL